MSLTCFHGFLIGIRFRSVTIVIATIHSCPEGLVAPSASNYTNSCRTMIVTVTAHLSWLWIFLHSYLLNNSL